MYKEALTEMNAKIGFKNDGVPLVVTEEMTEDECKDLILKAIPALWPTDYFSAPTNEVLKEFGWKREDVVDKEPRDEPELSLEDFINEAEKIKELKDIVLSEPQFKSIRGKIASFKDIPILKNVMLKMLKDPAPDIPEILHQKIEDEPIRIPVVEPSYHGTKNINEIHTRPPFSTLFIVNKDTLRAVTGNMMKSGYDPAYPIVLWKDVVIDGHTRLQAAIAAGISKVPVDVKEFKSEKAALNYAIHNQRDRRNLSDGELLKAIAVVDTPMTKADAGAKGGKGIEDKIEPTHKVTAKILGIGESVVTDARTVLADENARKEVEEGKKSIRQAAKKIREKKQKIKKEEKQEARRTLTPVEAVVRILKESAGNEVPVVSIVESADAILVSQGNKSDLIAMEDIVAKVLEVVEALKLIKFVTLDVISIRKNVMSYLEKIIEQKAESRFKNEFTNFMKMINDNSIGKLLKIKLVGESGKDKGEHEELMSLVNFYGITGRTFFNAHYKDVTEYGKELTNIQEIHDKLVEQFIKEETEGLFSKIKILKDYLENIET